MSKAESEAVLSWLLGELRRDARVRLGIGVALLGVLVYLAVRFVAGAMPHHYTLRITGGDIVDNKHFLARALAKATPRRGVDLVVRPADAALDAVSRGDVDLAFVEGGVDKVYPNVEHVAMVAPEVVHLLVRPDIAAMTDLKGRTIDLGPKDAALHHIARAILAFAGYQHGIDYVETNHVPEELLGLPDRKMPDAIFSVSSVPSYLVESLVKDRGYALLEIGFPEALALRYGWAGNARISAYSYSLSPPIPARDIGTVAVNVYLVANAHADPTAIEKVLETLYAPDLATATHMTFDDAKIGTPSGYPVNAAMAMYQHRNDTVFTADMWNRVQAVFGLIMTFSGMAIVLVKWFRGPPPKQRFDDAEFVGYIATVAGVEAELTELERAPDRDRLAACRDKVNGLRATVLARYADAKLKDPAAFDRCIASVRSCHDRIARLTAGAA